MRSLMISAIFGSCDLPRRIRRLVMDWLLRVMNVLSAILAALGPAASSIFLFSLAQVSSTFLVLASICGDSTSTP